MKTLIALILMIQVAFAQSGPVYNFNFYNGKSDNVSVDENNVQVQTEEEYVEEEDEYVDEEVVEDATDLVPRETKKKKAWSLEYALMGGSGSSESYSNDMNTSDASYTMDARVIGLKLFLSEKGLYINPRLYSGDVNPSGISSSGLFWEGVPVEGTGGRIGFEYQGRGSVTLDFGIGFYRLSGETTASDWFTNDSANYTAKLSGTEAYVGAQFEFGSGLYGTVEYALASGDAEFSKTGTTDEFVSSDTSGSRVSLALGYRF